MIRAIDPVGLTVTDLVRAVEFWCGRLGLRLVSRVTETGPDIAFLIGEDSVEIEIADLDAGDGRIIELIMYIRPAGRPIRARSSDPGSSHIALGVDDLDAALERIQGSQARQISRHSHPDVPRPYRLPGGMVGVWIAGGICTAFILLSSFIAVFPDVIEKAVGAGYNFHDTCGISRMRFEAFTLGTLAVIILFAIIGYWLGRPVREQEVEVALAAPAPA